LLKKINLAPIVIIIVIIFMFAFISCQQQKDNLSNSTTSHPKSTSKQKVIRVGMIYSFSSPQIFKERADNIASNDNDLAIIDINLESEEPFRTEKVIRQLADIGIDAICLVDLPPEQIEKCVNFAATFQIPVFIVTKTSVLSSPVYDLTIDYTQGAKLAEDYFKKQLGKGAKILVVHDEIPHNRDVAKDFEGIIKKDDSLNLVGVSEIKLEKKTSTVPGEISSKEKNQLHKQVGNILKKHRDVKGIFVLSEGSQIDVYKTLKKLKMNNVCMVSFGDEIRTMPLIFSGDILKANINVNWENAVKQLFNAIKENIRTGNVPKKKAVALILKDREYYQKNPLFTPQIKKGNAGAKFSGPPGGQTKMLPPGGKMPPQGGKMKMFPPTGGKMNIPRTGMSPAVQPPPDGKMKRPPRTGMSPAVQPPPDSDSKTHAPSPPPDN